MSLLNPNLAQFQKHARLFGTECVVETARGFLDEKELTELELTCNLLDGGGSRGRKTTSKLKEQIKVLSDQGLVVSAIADSLNLSDTRVKNILKEQAILKNTPRNGLNKP